MSWMNVKDCFSAGVQFFAKLPLCTLCFFLHLCLISLSLLSSYFLSFCIRTPSCFLHVLFALSWFPHVSFSYSILPRLLPTHFCSFSSISSPFLAFCTCCIHYQPRVMHIYCLQRSCLIRHVQRMRVNLLPPLAYTQPCLLSRATQTPIIYCVIYLWIKSFNFLLTSISQGGEDGRAD